MPGSPVDSGRLCLCKYPLYAVVATALVKVPLWEQNLIPELSRPLTHALFGAGKGKAQLQCDSELTETINRLQPQPKPL